jgi:hypothetical protein
VPPAATASDDGDDGDDGDDDGTCVDDPYWGFGQGGKGCSRLFDRPDLCRKKSADKRLGYEACPFLSGVFFSLTSPRVTPTRQVRVRAVRRERGLVLVVRERQAEEHVRVGGEAPRRAVRQARRRPRRGVLFPAFF